MHEAESLTRKKRIDTKLRSSNPSWIIVPYQDSLDFSKLTNHAVEELPTENGFADYALFVKGKLLGVIEAKKVGTGAQNVLEQAKRYSKTTNHGVGNWNGFRVPFVYSTNGETIWFADLRRLDYVSRPLNNFHTPNALLEMYERNSSTAFSWLDNNHPSQVERLRPYQIEAIQAIEEQLKNDRRAMLIAMATGTGKTFFTVAQIYRLLESKLFRSILFLVDRKALAAQAVREFNSFQTPHGNKFNQEYEIFSQRFRREDFGDDSPFDPKVLPESYLTNPDAAKTFVYVSTIQRMTINLFGHEKAFAQSSSDPDYEADAAKIDIPNNAFDLIIADECHRGYTSQETSTWRNALNHFDAVKVGLTATPAAHTVSLFGNPVFRYGVEKAIEEGFLVDYEPVKIKSNVKIDGVFLREGENIEKIDTQTGEKIFDELEDERKYESAQVEQEITVPDSNRKIIEEIARFALEHERKTGNFPKTLIFAVNDINHKSHADQIVTICREVFGRGDDFVQKITGNANVDRPLQKIREFRNRPNPKIVVTVDMLSTGVDIPALEYIVFLRPVRSRILWEQMLGRGTRLCSDINKTHFTVFDCFDGTLFEYFKDVSNFKIEPPTKKPTPTPQVIENIWQNVERSYHTGLLIKRLRRIEKNMTGSAREEFARFVPEGDVGKFTDTLAAELHKNFSDTMKILRDADFQNLMENYDRASKTFVVAIDAEDTVESERLERYGKYEKAEDYLEAFAEFVKTNAASVSALTILLTRPQDWQPNTLRELCQKLKEGSFKTEDLQKAHARIYHKELADLISMVKHAADEQCILLTARERVERAIEAITAGKHFDADQTRWLGLIQEHLATNLTIDEEDFEYQSIFRNEGGKGKARKVFGAAELNNLLREINTAIAA